MTLTKLLAIALVADAAAYNAAPAFGRGAQVRAAAASRRPALAVMHHGEGDHPVQEGAPAPEPEKVYHRVVPMALGAVAGAIAIKTVLLPTAAVAAGAAATVAPVSLSLSLIHI